MLCKRTSTLGEGGGGAFLFLVRKRMINPFDCDKKRSYAKAPSLVRQTSSGSH